jgi:hypothetical protein
MSNSEGMLFKRIFDETQEFRARLATLLRDETLLGKYVVFRHGKVHAVGETFETAYQKGLSLFGAASPFYVDVVEARDSIEMPIFAAAG